MKFLVVLFLLAVFTFAGSAQVRIEVKPVLPINQQKREYPKTAKSFESETLDGKSVRVGSIPWKEDKITVLHFWGTWCHDCTEEFAEFIKFADANPDVDFIAVSIDEPKEMVEKYFASIKFDPQKHNVRMLSNPDCARFNVLYNLASVPLTFFGGRDGRIVHVEYDGETDWNDVGLINILNELRK